MTVQELYSGPEKWAQNYYAFSAKGKMVEYTDLGAKSFCLIGAIYRCYPLGDDQAAARRKAISVIDKKYRNRARGEGKFDDPIVLFNDHEDTTFEEVKALVTAAGI